MFKRASLIYWLFLVGVCLIVSCNSFSKPPSINLAASTLAITKTSTDTVSIEIFIVHIAPHQSELLQQLWREVDEQSLPPQLRRELFVEGFRVGILGNLISPALTQLLNISGNAKTPTSGEFQEYSVADAVRETVNRHTRNLLPDMSALIKVFDEQNELPELSLFHVKNGLFCGKTYTKALGLFSVSVTANKDRSAQLQVVPAMEHGIVEQRFRTVSGIVIPDTSRPRHIFESLRISQRLLPGQWLIIGATPDSTGVGKAFFMRKGMVSEQRLLAIRLAHITPGIDSTSTALSLPPTVPRMAVPKMAGNMPERH